MFEGSLCDPHGEFCVSVNPKYMSTRGRTYWTRGCRLLEDLIPDFMVDVGREVLGCGRAMNLLKLCVTKVRKKVTCIIRHLGWVTVYKIFDIPPYNCLSTYKVCVFDSTKMNYVKILLLHRGRGSTGESSCVYTRRLSVVIILIIDVI